MLRRWRSFAEALDVMPDLRGQIVYGSDDSPVLLALCVLLLSELPTAPKSSGGGDKHDLWDSHHTPVKQLNRY
jgi:hypothetical protein